MELYRVAIKDIRPDANNPRKDFGDIEALAESFKLNPADPCEPLQPIITVRDGNVFRIVDGERRYRAMKHLGVIECWSNVCEDFEEADSVVQMLATNDKLELDEYEKSLGVQTMLLLGVDEQVVERAAHVQGAKKIRRAMNLAPRAPQMTLEWLLAIAEADEAGDEEAVKALAAAQEQSWAAKADRYRRERKAAAEYDEAVSIATAIGFTVLDDEPEDGQLGDFDWVGSSECTDEEVMRKYFTKGYHHVHFEANSWGVSGHVYMDQGCELSDEEENPEEAECARKLEEARQKIKDIRLDAKAWLGREFAAGNTGGAVGEWFDEKFPESTLNVTLEAFEEESGVDVLPEGLRPPVLVALLCERLWPSGYYNAYAAAGLGIDDWRKGDARRWLDFYAMLKAAGWNPPEHYAQVRDAIEATLEDTKEN